ncbi:hypothetical protein ACGFZG_33980 [Streptomyces antibioticus]|uniref:hypothetical protein n=1 Tax=Streptomyces antibioticus TaxID=1890 RepID=UPI003711BD38
MDADGGTLRDRPELDRVRGLVIPPAWQDVWICARPNGHLQAMGTDAASTSTTRSSGPSRSRPNTGKAGKAAPWGWRPAAVLLGGTRLARRERR